MLVRFGDLSQSDCSKWVMWQVKDIGIDTKIEVIVASPTTWEAHHSPRASQVVGDATMTEMEVSISILSWWNKINYK